MSQENTFENTCETWANNCNLWSDCLDEVIDVIGGARNPQEWGDYPFDTYEDNLDQYLKDNPDKKQRLIQIYIKCLDKKSEKTAIVSEKDIKIKVNNVKFILETLNEANVNISKIKDYSDDDLRDILG